MSAFREFLLTVVVVLAGIGLGCAIRDLSKAAWILMDPQRPHYQQQTHQKR